MPESKEAVGAIQIQRVHHKPLAGTGPAPSSSEPQLRSPGLVNREAPERTGFEALKKLSLETCALPSSSATSRLDCRASAGLFQDSSSCTEGSRRRARDGATVDVVPESAGPAPLKTAFPRQATYKAPAALGGTPVHVVKRKWVLRRADAPRGGLAPSPSPQSPGRQRSLSTPDVQAT